MPIPDVEKSAAHAATPNSSSRPSKFAVHDAFFDRTGMFWVRSSAVKRLLQWILFEEIFARFLLSAILYGLKVFQCPVDGCEEIPSVSFAGEETPMEPIQALVVISFPVVFLLWYCCAGLFVDFVCDGLAKRLPFMKWDIRVRLMGCEMIDTVWGTCGFIGSLLWSWHKIATHGRFLVVTIIECIAFAVMGVCAFLNVCCQSLVWQIIWVKDREQSAEREKQIEVWKREMANSAEDIKKHAESSAQSEIEVGTETKIE